MKDLARYRAMESLCRQSAAYRPLESWRLLAEAEMWHHKAQEEIASHFEECDGAARKGISPQPASLADARGGSRPPAG